MTKVIVLTLLWLSFILNLWTYWVNAEQNNEVHVKVLSDSMKTKLDVVVEDFFMRIEWEYKNNNSEQLKAFNKSSEVLIEYWKEHTEYKNIILYVLVKIHTKIEEVENNWIQIIDSQNEKVKVSVKKDIQYKQNCSKCSLDIYYKKDNIKDKKVIFFVHWGAWKLWDKWEHEIKWNYFANKNYIFTSVNHTLFPEAEYKTQAEETAKAFKYVHSNIEKFGWNKDHIVMMWHSAWGHLISLLSTKEDYLVTEWLSLSSISSTILLDSAWLDILWIKEAAPLIFKIAYKDVFGSVENDLVEASPISHISKWKNIPEFLIFYSNQRSNIESIPNTFHDTLVLNNIESSIYPVNKTHEEINEEIWTFWDIITQKIVEFLE